MASRKDEEAEIGSVAGPAPFQRVNGRLANVPGRDKIRLPHAEGDDILHALDDVKKIADARARDGGHGLRDKLFGLEFHRSSVAAVYDRRINYFAANMRRS